MTICYTLVTTSDQKDCLLRVTLVTGNDGDGRVEGWLFGVGDAPGGHCELTDGSKRRAERITCLQCIPLKASKLSHVRVTTGCFHNNFPA